MQAGFNASDPLVSVNVGTGELRYPIIPVALSGSKRFLLNHGAVSPQNEVVAAAEEAAGKTFLWKLREGAVGLLHGDPWPTQDNYHVWAPDGEVLVFKRRRLDLAGGGSVIVRLQAATGVQDTVFQLPALPGRSFERLRWVGTDTLLLDWFEPNSGTDYRVLQLSSGEAIPFEDLTHLGHSVPPTFSPDGRWMTYLAYRDSLATNGEVILLLSRRLRDRKTGEEREYEADIRSDLGAGSASTAFSPDDQFFAACETDTTLAIHHFLASQPVRRIPVPYCHRLSWAKGGQ